MKSRSILTRLAKLEESVGAAEDGTYRHYFVQGPFGMDGHEYLRSLGYELPARAIVIHIVDAIDGRPADTRAADLTPQYAPENALTEFGG